MAAGQRVRGRGSKHGLVYVFKSVNGEKGEFLRYETPGGVPCDEHGVELGVVNFSPTPPDPEDEEETELEPEEVLADAEGGKR